MATYKTPGVYVEEVAHTPPTIAYAGDTISAFIGYTQKADKDNPGDLHLQPTRIASMLDYQRHFGSAQSETGIEIVIAYPSATKLTTAKSGARFPGKVTPALPKITTSFAPGSRSLHKLYYAMLMYFANGGGECYIVSAGLYKPVGSAIDKTELNAGLDAVHGVDSVTLLVMPEAQTLPWADYKALHDAALSQCAAVNNRFLVLDLPNPEDGNLLNAAAQFRDRGIGNQNLKYGAAYATNVIVSLPLAIDESAVKVTQTKNGVLAPTTLEVLAKSDPDLYQQVLQSLSKLPCELPPSALVAGVYVNTERQRGYWKAPANVSLSGIIKPTIEIDDQDHGSLNVDAGTGKSINAIRSFTGRGTRVWGARTLAGNDNEWRYINISRMVRGIETSIDRAMAQFVFEPNDANTWTRIRAMVESFLQLLWRDGGLQGAKPEHAFYVRVGLGSTMSSLDILESRMIVEVGLAAIRPAEFIVIRIKQRMSES